MKDGGSIVTIGGSTDLGKALGLPLADQQVGRVEVIPMGGPMEGGRTLAAFLDRSKKL